MDGATQITVDYRTGSSDLLPLLKARGLPAVSGHLAFGDVSWLGNGPEGMPIPVGIEYKTIRDVLKCVTDGRFAGHQLPGLMGCYQIYGLLIEGRWRPCMRTGILQVMSNRGQWVNATVGARGFMYKDLVHWLTTMQVKCNLQVWRTYDEHETGALIHGMYTWWTVKEWEAHRAHLALNESANAGLVDRAILVRPSMVRRLAKELPGVGWDRSRAIAERFRTVPEMWEASRAEWQTIPGIGKVTASKIYEVLHGRQKA